MVSPQHRHRVAWRTNVDALWPSAHRTKRQTVDSNLSSDVLPSGHHGYYKYNNTNICVNPCGAALFVSIFYSFEAGIANANSSFR